MNTWKRHRSDT